MKAKLRPYLWALCDGTVGALADRVPVDRHAPGLPDHPPRRPLRPARAPATAGVARHAAIARRHAVPLLDLTGAFDEDDPNELALAPWDDHPNAEGHKLIFYALARALVADAGLSRLLFGAEGGGRVLDGPSPDVRTPGQRVRQDPLSRRQTPATPDPDRSADRDPH